MACIDIVSVHLSTNNSLDTGQIGQLGLYLLWALV